MERLANINFSRKQLNELIHNQFFSSGGEAIICRTNNPSSLYKIFMNRNLKEISMNENKFQKLLRIHNLRLKRCVMPLKTIACDGKLIGYEMTYNQNESRFFPGEISRQEVINKLLEVKQILQYLATKDITYGDISFRNILFNKQTGKVKFCDIDNIRIGNLPIDSIPRALQNYEDICGIDENTDGYMHNLLTLKTLGLDINYCEEEDIEKCFLNPAVQIVEMMKEPENFTGEYIIEYVKK